MSVEHAFEVVKDVPRLLGFIDHDDGVNRACLRPTPHMRHVETFTFERLQHEARKVIVSQDACIRASRTEPSRRHECRRRQATAVSFAPLDLHLAVGRRIRRDIQQIVHRDAAEPQDVK